MTSLIDRTILITGGAGSFGTALIRTLLAAPHGPCRILALSRNAAKRYELEQTCTDPRLVVVPGDVRLLSDLEAAIAGESVDVLIHAAAEKYIGTGERYAQFVRSTNIDGARHVIALAAAHRIPRVLALSTDKACLPINEYGRTKAEAERLFLQANQQLAHTRCTVVRYGNVVGSSGSVIPLFIKQRSSGRLTITDRRMTRYWMPLSIDSQIRVLQEPGAHPVVSAVELVLYALEHMAGSEIFVPQLPSALVADVADEIGRGCETKEIGIRDGEKIHEDLIASEEGERTWVTPNGVYAIMPDASTAPRMAGCVRVPSGFHYSSDQAIQPVRFEQIAT